MKNIFKKIERADAEDKQIIIMGDANVCASKWNNSDFALKDIADEIRSTLASCGLKNMELGHTYLADRLSENGETIQSCSQNELQ